MIYIKVLNYPMPTTILVSHYLFSLSFCFSILPA
nr:MAG TPA: hypothetical protein [Caudoviricetes sp.]